jgi:hypothetical protein
MLKHLQRAKNSFFNNVFDPNTLKENYFDEKKRLTQLKVCFSETSEEIILLLTSLNLLYRPPLIVLQQY